MISYEELYEKYQKLLEENNRLRIENKNYKVQLGLACQNSIPVRLRIKSTCLCLCPEEELMHMQRNAMSLGEEL